jgi:hypothetical protein
MTDFIESREQVIRALREELVGPSPQGEPLDCSKALRFPDWDAAEGPYRQHDTGEEILTGDRPVKRYGIGVLYPLGLLIDQEPAVTPGEEAALEEAADEDRDQDADHPEPKVVGRTTGLTDTESDADMPLSTANAYRPSSLGVSFLAILDEGPDLVITVTGGRYVAKEVTVAREGSDREITWWLRKPVTLTARFSPGKLLSSRGLVKPDHFAAELPQGWEIGVAVLTRPRPDGSSLLTATVVNRTPPQGQFDANCLFQAHLSARIEGVAAILPYEEAEAVSDEAELRSLALLYRNSPSFGVGHGCAADWDTTVDPQRAEIIKAVALPVAQTPSITPELLDPTTKRRIEVPMAPLAGLGDWEEGNALTSLIDAYTAWIDDEQGPRVEALPQRHRETALEHLQLCREARDRMIDGLKFLDEDPDARRAFELANWAMLLQQGRSSHPPRPTTFNREHQRIEVEGTFTPTERGAWRPFQIAFVLAALRSTARSDDEGRDIVELIFFPTGGGKTEAYLALTAFSIFYRRLRDPQDAGVDVLMRYTLRLLTAQQFQRASALICAMEHLRNEGVAPLGDAEFSIGVWLGQSATPNNRTEATAALRALQREGKTADNPFVLLKCPWCAAQMGPIERTGQRRSRGPRTPEPKIAGYDRRGDTVALRCPDASCDYNRALPVYVIDTDVYEQRPSLVIGTVDKFAMLAFRPEARSLFGIGPDGRREKSPPNLIIQDELHLISGPLGSMVGLYEALIEELCTDRRTGSQLVPKIIGSTATIRRFERQIHDLYARDRTMLFPPRGLDAGDSFFARYAQDGEGNLLPGRVYVGIHGPGLGSIQTAQVRTFASILQAVAMLPEEERDPWWTLMAFFNSLRELGTSLSLLQSDIPDYLRVLRKRFGLELDQTRRPWNVLELTGRLRNDEVPQAILALERAVGSTGTSPVDVCLASNIVEVGVDVPRLSLMTVIGQPKTTSQYIQATGRVGRRWEERPGLIATIYGASKPRDRSHFEKFKTYHERLYAEVEPTSVTPFAPPVLDRALHAVAVAYVRQLGEQDQGPRPIPDELLDAAHQLLSARVLEVDADEAERFEAKFAQRVAQWRRWERVDWQDSGDGDIGLLRFAGEYADRVTQQVSWAVPTSMRNVDAECRAEVTQAYIINPDEA